MEWMSDFEKLQEALDNSGDESYMNSLNRSLALVLDEFYNALTAVGVSAASGDGMPALFKVRTRLRSVRRDMCPSRLFLGSTSDHVTYRVLS